MCSQTTRRVTFVWLSKGEEIFNIIMAVSVYKLSPQKDLHSTLALMDV